MLFVPGEKASLVTEIPSAGGGVFPIGCVTGPVEPPPPAPPQANAQAIANTAQTCFNICRLRSESSRIRYAGAQDVSSIFSRGSGGLLLRRGEGMITHREFS